MGMSVIETLTFKGADVTQVLIPLIPLNRKSQLGLYPAVYVYYGRNLTMSLIQVCTFLFISTGSSKPLKYVINIFLAPLYPPHPPYPPHLPVILLISKA